MTARIPPAVPPFAPEVQRSLERLMPPGRAPLVLFTTLARDPRLFGRFAGAGLLDRGHLALRQREIVIDRTCARCASTYEWGVHVALFAARVGLGAAELASLAHGGAGDACWADDERALIELCDALHERCDVDDAPWRALREHFSDEALIELLLLAGFYRTVSYLTNALRLPHEPDGAAWPAP